MNLAVDNENNAIITFVDQRSGPWGVYAYKINPYGEMIWGMDGLSLSNSSLDNISPRLVVLQDNSVVVSWSKNYNSVVPLGRLGQTSDVASAVLFLSSEASSYITGTDFLVDGGWTCI